MKMFRFLRLRHVMAIGLFLFAGNAGQSQNSALNFNGTTTSYQYMQVAASAPLNLSGTFTIEAWIYPTGNGPDATDGGTIINKESSYEIARFANGTIEFELSANGTGSDWSWVNSGLVAPLNQWSHVALVKNGTSVTVYLNGLSTYTNNAQPATMTANVQNLQIGDRSSPVTETFQGNIDEVRIWSTARTQANILGTMYNQNLALNASGMVAYWRMNEGAGTTTANSCTNTTGIDGVFSTTTTGPPSSSPPSWVASPVQFGKNSLNFDGVNDYVNVPHVAAQDITTNLTIEAWCYITNTTTAIQDVVSKSSQAINTGYIFPRTDNAWTNVVIYLYIGGWKVYSAPAPTLNAWHHLAATYDGATVRIYIDGVLKTSAAQTGAIATNTNALAIGVQPGYSEYFGGSVDEVRIWNVVRTQAQIQANMNTEIDPTVQTGLVSYYTFDQGITSGTNTGIVTLIDHAGTANGTLTNMALTGSSSNFIAQFSGIVPLPLEWLSFTAQRQDNDVLLQWSTAVEKNTRDFTVQHSLDQLTWDSIGVVAAAGNSTTQENYRFLHNSPANGLNYYRILERDVDGQENYSSIQYVAFNTTGNAILEFNNPVSNGVLKMNLSVPAHVFLYNLTGQLIWTGHCSPGTSTVNLNNCSAGTYILSANGQSYKLIVR